MLFFFSSRRRHTRLQGDWSSDVCSSDLKQHHVVRLAEDHVVGRRGASHIYECRTGPAFEHRSVSLTKTHDLSAFDVEGVQYTRRAPGQLCASVHEDVVQWMPNARPRRILDLYID